MVFLNVWNPACPLGKMSPAKTWHGSVAVSSERECRAFTDGALGFPRYTEWPKKNATILIRYFNDILDWIPFLLYWIEYFFPSNLIRSSQSMDKAFWFQGCYSEAVSFSKCATFPLQAGLKQLEFISSDGCVDKSIIALTLKRKTIWMKARHSLRNFVALNSNCFKPACGGKSSTFWKWHCLRKIAL